MSNDKNQSMSKITITVFLKDKHLRKKLKLSVIDSLPITSQKYFKQYRLGLKIQCLPERKVQTVTASTDHLHICISMTSSSSQIPHLQRDPEHITIFQNKFELN